MRHWKYYMTCLSCTPVGNLVRVPTDMKRPKIIRRFTLLFRCKKYIIVHKDSKTLETHSVIKNLRVILRNILNV